MNLDDQQAPGAPAAADTAPSAPSGRSLSDSIEASLSSVFGEGGGDVYDEAPAGDEGGTGALRDDKGRFAAQTAAEASAPVDPAAVAAAEAASKAPAPQDVPTNPAEAPTRLSNEAKAAWGAVPPAVQADIHRTIREMETGIGKYRETAARWDAEIQPYEALAQQYGLGGVKGVLADYEGMSRMMASNPMAVFESLAKRHGFTLQDVASKVLDMDLDEYAEEANNEIARLQAEVNELRQQNGTFTERQRGETRSLVAEFAATHPRYQELESTIAGVLKSNLITATTPQAKLQEAYEIAERLKPAASAPPAPQNPALVDQTRKGKLSLPGASGPGSDPATRKPPSSAREAVDKAFDKFGL